MNLKAYLDGDLPPAEAAEVERALATDSALREELEQLRSLSASLRAYAPDPMPVGMEDTLLALTAVRRPRPIWGRLALLGTGALAVLAIALTLNRAPGNEMTVASQSSAAKMSAESMAADAVSSTAPAPAMERSSKSAPLAVRAELVLQSADPKALENWARRNASVEIRALPSGQGSVITVAQEALESTMESLAAIGIVETQTEAREEPDVARRSIEANLPRYRAQLAELEAQLRRSADKATRAQADVLRDQIAIAEAQRDALGAGTKAIVTVTLVAPARPSSAQSGP